MVAARSSFFRHYGILFASVATIALAGCTTTSVASGPAVKAPAVSEEEEIEKWAHALEQAAADSSKLFRETYRNKIYPSHTVSPKVKSGRIADGIELQSSWTLDSPAAFYEPGQFVFAGRDNDRGAKEFINLTSRYLTDATESLQREGTKVAVEVEYSGQADGAPNAGAGVVYAGEFGYDLHMPANATTLNGEKGEIHIRTGDRLTNLQLAALRAYALTSYVRNVANGPLVGSTETFRATTTDEVGARYRFARLTIKIRVIVPNVSNS